MNETASSKLTKRKLNLWQRGIGFVKRLSLWNKLALAFLILALPLGYGSLLLLKPFYKEWRANNALKIAETSIAAEDFNAASLAFRTAIRSRPKDPEIWRRVAAFLDQIGSPEALSVWSRAVKLDPRDIDSKYSLIASAVQQKRLEQASAVLAEIPTDETKTIAYHRAAANIAIAANDPSTAERELVAWLELEPNAPVAQWDLARVRFMSGDPAVRDTARETLRTYAEGEGTYALPARRLLVRVFLAASDFYTANREAERLITDPEATAEDQILFLDTEFAAQSFTLPGSISGIFEHALANPEAAPPILNYLAARGLSDRIATWFDSLPPDLADNESIQMARFEYARRSGDWSQVFAILRSASSPYDLPAELVDLTEQALADFRRGDSGALPIWQKAIFLTQSNPAAAFVLANLSEASSWREAYSLALWSLANSVGNRSEIWQEVLKVELADGNSTGILRALSGAVRADSDNRRLRNDWVLMNLLLEQGEPRQLVELARENYEYESDNSFYATTFALGLAAAGETDEAAAVIDRIPEDEQRQPAKALYVGSVLAMDGQFERAKLFLDLATKARDSFLPEERMMFDQSLEIASGARSIEDQLARMTDRSGVTDEQSEEFRETLRAQLQDARTDAETENVAAALRDTVAGERSSPDDIQAILRDIQSKQPDGALEAPETSP